MSEKIISDAQSTSPSANNSRAQSWDRKTIQDFYIRVCRDSGFRCEYINAAKVAALALEIHPIQVWMAFPCLNDMERIAAGTHPALARAT